MLVIVAPGQGAQKPGFLAPWLEDPRTESFLAHLSDVACCNLLTHGTVSDETTIRDTAIAQPLLVGAALAVADRLNETADIVAGHSVGELAAISLAGVLTPDDAIRLAAARGRAMARAAATQPTSMLAVIGSAPDDIAAAAHAAGLTVANYNGHGQLVLAGTLAQVDALRLPGRTMTVPLQVAGAFHTHHMAPAVEELREAVVALSPQEPSTTLLTNADGSVIATGEGAVARLVEQVAQPVRWDLCQATMAELGVTGLLELCPAGTLAGLARRTLPGVERFTLDRPDQLDAAREFCRRHRDRVDS